MNYKKILKNTGKIMAGVVLATGIANYTYQFTKKTEHNGMNFAEQQFLSGSQRKKIADFINPDSVYEHAKKTHDALVLVVESQAAVDAKINYESGKNTLEDSLNGTGNCVAHAGLTYATFLNIVERDNNLRNLVNDVRYREGYDEKIDASHAWLQVYNHNSNSWVDIETTVDSKKNNYINARVLKRFEKQAQVGVTESHRLSMLITDNSHFGSGINTLQIQLSDDSLHNDEVKNIPDNSYMASLRELTIFRSKSITRKPPGQKNMFFEK